MIQTTRFLLTTVLLLLLGASSASAQKLGALQVDVSGTEPLVRQSIDRAIERAGNSGKFSFIDEKAMRAKLTAQTRDCFTTTCLKAAQKQTGADGGIRVRFSGEAQIYDWTVDVYDLHTGQLAASKKGACELCGAADVRQQFEASVRAAVATSKITKPAAVASKPKPRPDPDPEPQPDPQPTSDPLPADPPPIAEAQPNDDPLAGLVMVEITATPSDTVISMGGQEIGQGTVTVSLEHGSYDIAFRREGYGGVNETLVIGPQTSQKAFFRVHLSKTDPDAVMVAGEGPLDRLGKKRRLYGLGALGAGGVLLTTGIVLSAIDGSPTCGDDNGNCPRVYETSALAFATTFTGAFLGTAGAVLLAWDVLSGRAEQQPRAARVVPFVGQDTAGIGVVGRF